MTESTTPDVGSVIARAAELKQQSEDTLTPQQLRDVAAELGIEPGFVDDAVKDLKRRQEANKQALAERKARNKKLIGAFIAFDIAIVVVLALSVQTARAEYSNVSAAQAAVTTSLQRQTETQRLFGGRTGEREADAELAGALNRVAIAKQRYDAAATSWNAHGPFTGIGADLAGLPEQVQLSHQMFRLP